MVVWYIIKWIFLDGLTKKDRGADLRVIKVPKKDIDDLITESNNINNLKKFILDNNIKISGIVVY